MARNKKKDDVMDMVENFGEGIGRRLAPRRPWLIKAIIMSISIIVLSAGIVFVAVFKKSSGGKK